MVLWAAERHPYGYYELMRWVIALTWAFTAWRFYRYGWPIVAALGVLVVVLHNPISPIHMRRWEWRPYDVATALASIAAVGMLWYLSREAGSRQAPPIA
jgi:hypothetical protein